MALCARLCTKGFIGLHGVRGISVTQCCRKVMIQPTSYQLPKQETHDEKNMRLQRPQSPHLTIYKFQLPANLSITHRFTGMALSGYLAGLGITSLIINRPMGEFITTLSSNYPAFFVLLKLGLVFPFTYHFFNGIRHLVWDTGNALTLASVYSTGYAMLAASILTAGALFYYQEIQKEETLRKKKQEEIAKKIEDPKKKKK